MNRVTTKPLSTEGSSTTLGYDNVGNVTHTATYDSTYGLQSEATYTYDYQGRMLTETDPNGTITYGYNLAGWLTSLVDGANNTTSYGYDLDGRVTKTVNPIHQTDTTSYDYAD